METKPPLTRASLPEANEPLLLHFYRVLVRFPATFSSPLFYGLHRGVGGGGVYTNFNIKFISVRLSVLHNSFTYPLSESDRTGVAGFFKAKLKRILGHILICENTSEMSRVRLA